ncbi:MAG TPA: hypothetical protein VHP36_09820 [Chitinispirillaceae bacterium]|nr:hypothetical protein [Chitinispirillaceae bacterium]
MPACYAPSEVDGIDSQEASIFGQFAEELIFADFCKQFPPDSRSVFRDNYNHAGYIYFLAINNPHFTKEKQLDYEKRVYAAGMGKVPDFIVHQVRERAFYEVKPDSVSGHSAGLQKIDIIQMIYYEYALPYKLGSGYTPHDHLIAYLGSMAQVKLKVRYFQNGLLVYKLCVETKGIVELSTLLILLKFIIRMINQNRIRYKDGFRPIDLVPVFQSEISLADLAAKLGIITGSAIIIRATWKHFWKAVSKRFALRGAAALGLAAADGPLPVGDLIALGLSIWTVFDIISLYDVLWRDAERIASQSA